MEDPELLDLDRCVAEYLSLVERELLTLIPASLSVPKLRDAVTHGVFPGGKRIRPLLSLLLCRDLGGDPRSLVKPAAGLELLHNSSLIHDDLPAMDNDDLRRGRPTVHKAFDEATAILAGDSLIGLAMKSITTAEELSSEIRVALLSELSTTFIELCDGQQLDISGDRSLDQLRKIHRMKTGALFRASTSFGALGANAPSEVVKVAAELGLAIGICFQVVDDYLDSFGARKGRTQGSDQRNDRKTFFSDGNQLVGRRVLLEVREEVERLISALLSIHGGIELPGVRWVLEGVLDRVGE